MGQTVLSGLLALVLVATPALSALCGVDCGAAAAQAEARQSEEGAHQHHAPGVVRSAHEEPPPGRDLPEPHDCHSADGPTDVPAIGAGPESCTHVRVGDSPAKLTPADWATGPHLIALPVTFSMPARMAGAPDGRSSAAPAAAPSATGLTLPLRI